MRNKTSGFTLIELMIVVAIIGVLTAIGVVNYSNAARKSEEGVTKGNLGAIRSALAIYFTDQQAYPTDDLSSITNNSHYLFAIPLAHMPPYHAQTTLVMAETTLSDSGEWSYNNSSTDPGWGAVHVGCLHQDMTAQVWSIY